MKTLDNFLTIPNTERINFLNFSDLSNVAVIFLSLEFNILDYNKTVEKIYGWHKSDVINKSYFKWFEDNQLPPPIVLKDKDDFLSRLPIFGVENCINNGEYVFQWNIVFNSGKVGEPKEIILIGQDVTDKKSLEQYLKKLAYEDRKKMRYDESYNQSVDDYIFNVSTYLEKVITCMPTYVYLKDRNFVYLNCNDLVANALNLKSRKDIAGKTDYDFGWDIAMVNEYRRVDEEIIKTKQPRIDLEEKIVVHGEEVYILTSKMPIFNKRDEAVGIIGISIDITERKRNEKELVKAKEEAEAANKLKTEFIRNVEHDIRTPFSGILGMTKILAKLEADVNKKQIIDDIYSCTQELLDYCSGVLNYSKIESGAFPVRSKKFSLRNLLNRVVVLETPAAKVKNIDFSMECDEDICDQLIGDEYRLERVLINLISNAIKFTQVGFIRLIVKNVKKINVRDIVVSFIIEDSGIGIPADKLDIIFEKFSRVLPSNHGFYKGQGLGLRIVKQFIEEMEGDIDIDSTLGQGSRFCCTLLFKLPLGEE